MMKQGRRPPPMKTRKPHCRWPLLMLLRVLHSHLRLYYLRIRMQNPDREPEWWRDASLRSSGNRPILAIYSPMSMSVMSATRLPLPSPPDLLKLAAPAATAASARLAGRRLLGGPTWKMPLALLLLLPLKEQKERESATLLVFFLHRSFNSIETLLLLSSFSSNREKKKTSKQPWRYVSRWNRVGSPWWFSYLDPRAGFCVTCSTVRVLEGAAAGEEARSRLT